MITILMTIAISIGFGWLACAFVASGKTDIWNWLGFGIGGYILSIVVLLPIMFSFSALNFISLTDTLSFLVFSIVLQLGLTAALIKTYQKFFDPLF